MAIAPGSYTVGPGKDYANWGAVQAALNGSVLTGDVTLMQDADIVAEPGGACTVGLAGHNLTLGNNIPHNGDPNAGYEIDFQTSSNLVMQITQANPDTGNGIIEIKDLKVISSGVLGFPGGIIVTTESGCRIHRILMLGTRSTYGSGSPGIKLYAHNSAAADIPMEIWNCEVNIPCDYGIDFSYGGAVSEATLQIENNTVHESGQHCYRSYDGTPATARNNVGFNAGVSVWQVAEMGAVLGLNNASDDSSAQDSNFKSGSSNNQTGIDEATEFESLTDTDANYLKVTNAGVCGAGGTTPGISGNTAGIRGNARASSIGADEFSAGGGGLGGSGSGGGISGAITAAMQAGY
jgi:hypothetical protein